MAGTPIRELVIKVGVEFDGGGFDNLDKAQDKSTTGSAALGVALGTLAADLVKVGLEALKTGAALAIDLVFGTAEAADGIAKTAAQLDITTEGLQRVRGAAKLTGGDADTLDKGIRILTKGLADASLKGTGPAAEGLATLGLEVAEVDSFLAEGDIEGALGVIGDKFNETGNSAEKSAALLKLFGGAGSKLRPLIEEGTAGVKALGDEISATGSVIDDEALGQFEDMVDANFLLEKQVEGVKNQIAGALAPAVTDIAAAVQVWVSENQDFISQDLPAFLSEVGGALVTVVGAGLDWIDTARELARDTADFAEIAFELAEGIADDLEPAIDGVTEAMEFFATPLAAVTDGALSVAGAIGDMVLEFADAIGVADELNAALKTLRETFGEDEDITTTRGGATFLAGGSSLVNVADADAARASGDTTKLKKIAADDQFSDGDRAKAAALAGQIDEREAGKAEKAAGVARAERQASIDASRARSAAARPKRRGGGGGGGARAAAAPAASVDDLIATAIGAASGGGPARVGGDELAGTMIVNMDQSVTINNGDVTLEFAVEGGVPGGGSIEDLGGVVRGEVDSALAARDKMTFDFYRARLNVGGG